MSLKLYVSMIFLSLTAVLVIGYSLLSARYYLLGMDSVTASRMVEAVTAYLVSDRQKPETFVTRYNGYLLARKWTDMPESIRSQIPDQPTESGKLVVIDNDGFLKPPDKVTFAMVFRKGGVAYYIARQETHLPGSPISTRSAAEGIIGKNSKQSLHTLFFITLASALVIGLITWLILRQVSKPVSALGEWARSLDEEKLQQPAPDFYYPELNELAGLIRTSLTSVQEGLDREHRFLRHASHELRTPISVIRNNVELIQRLQQRSMPDLQDKQQQVIDRIDRASLSMKHLTETLLWLSREDERELSVQPVRLDRLVNELTENLWYLTTGKEVDIDIKTSPCLIEIPETVASIVLGNLIRNAFQHTYSGAVSIEQQDNLVRITNLQHGPVQNEDDLGFGLGLQLIWQLTEKVGWTCESHQDCTGTTVTVTLVGRILSPVLASKTTIEGR